METEKKIDGTLLDYFVIIRRGHRTSQTGVRNGSIMKMISTFGLNG